METLYLAKPSLAWKEEILAYKQAFTGEHLHGGSHLQQMDNFEEWLEHVENETSPEITVGSDGLEFKNAVAVNKKSVEPHLRAGNFFSMTDLL